MSARGVTENPLEFVFEEKTLDIKGHTFTFRELTVGENDACLDAARLPDGTINGRINMRMQIAKGSIEPKITMDDIAKMPNWAYIRLAEFVNELNNEFYEEAPAEGDEGNA